MQIIFDHQIFSAQKYGGISRYFVELANHIADAETAQVRVLSPVYVNAYLAARSTRVRVTGFKMPAVRYTGRIYRAVNQALSGLLLPWFKPDLVHETYYASKPAKPRGYKIVLTVYDMIHELFPADFAANDSTPSNKAAAVARADHVICISENTRRDLIKLLGVPREKTSVVHLGFSLQTGGARVDLPVRRPYLLYVGARGGYKNFACLLQAYAASSALTASFDLVAFGGGPFTAKEAELARQLGIPPENLRQVQGGDDVLAGLYRRAAAFVYPSLYEGFGIPPLEAMSFDCPVVCSNTSSIPEVVGDAAMLFDPLSAVALGQALAGVLDNAGLRQALISRGRERIKHFSWEQCAQQTMAVYEQILAKAH
jgi:glycosyltransferase involved in cell wall biosynthesis